MQWCGRDYPHESSAKSSSRKLKLGTNGWRECRVWISQDLLDFCVARSFRTAAALNTGTQECGALLVDQLGFTSCFCRCCLYADTVERNWCLLSCPLWRGQHKCETKNFSTCVVGTLPLIVFFLLELPCAIGCSLFPSRCPILSPDVLGRSCADGNSSSNKESN